MTVTLNNVNESIFEALRKIVLEWQNVEIKTDETDISKKSEILSALFEFTKIHEHSSDGKGWQRDELYRY